MNVNDKVIHEQLGEGIIVATHKTDKLLGDKWVRVQFNKRPPLMYNAGVNPYVVEVSKISIINKNNDTLIFNEKAKQHFEQWNYEQWKYNHRNDSVDALYYALRDIKFPCFPKDLKLPKFETRYRCDKCNGYFSEEELSNHVCDARIYNKIINKDKIERAGLHSNAAIEMDKLRNERMAERFMHEYGKVEKYYHNEKETFYVENPSNNDYICIIENDHTEIAFRFDARQKYDLTKRYTIGDLRISKTLKHALDIGKLKRLTHQEYHDYVAVCAVCSKWLETEEEAHSHKCGKKLTLWHKIHPVWGPAYFDENRNWYTSSDVSKMKEGDYYIVGESDQYKKKLKLWRLCDPHFNSIGYISEDGKRYMSNYLSTKMNKDDYEIVGNLDPFSGISISDQIKNWGKKEVELPESTKRLIDMHNKKNTAKKCMDWWDKNSVMEEKK
jgi:hypothetical protein